MANIQRQVFDLRVAKGFTEAQSNEYKRNWGDRKWSHAEKRVRGLTTMVANLEQKQTELTSEIARLTEELQSGRGDAEELRRHIDRLNQDYGKVLAALADKRQKLSEANRKLAEYRELEEQSKEQAEENLRRAEQYKADLREAASDVAEQVNFRVAYAMLSDLVADIRSLYPDPDNAPDEKMRLVAAQGTDLLKCAAMLFAGYVDGATTFAQNHSGGGSGGNDLPWGRKEDEDDLRWARRCLMQASRMMRPATGKPLRRK